MAYRIIRKLFSIGRLSVGINTKPPKPYLYYWKGMNAVTLYRGKHIQIAWFQFTWGTSIYNERV